MAQVAKCIASWTLLSYFDSTGFNLVALMTLAQGEEGEFTMKTVSLRVLLLPLLLFAVTMFVACSKNSTGDDDVVQEDGIAPSAILDLAVVSFTDTSVTLSWTAPGDDSTSGTATRYDLRYSTEMITFDNFIDADQVSYVPAPQISGTVQSVEVVGLTTNTRYYFSIVALDERDNYTSPCVICTPFLDVEVDFPDAALEAAVRDALNQPSGPLMRSQLITLKEIRAEDAGIASLTGLEYCDEIEGLLFTNNNITDLTPLAGLSRLWGLNFYGNDINDLTPLAGISNLVQLNLGANKFTSIAPLQNLPNLLVLRLHENTISDLTPVGSISSVEDLDLHSCHLSNISFLSSLTNVKWLQLQVNQISDISSLSALTQLRQVILGFNSITDISALSSLADLETIDLTHNQVSDITALVNNAGIGSGDVVRIEQNPLSQAARTVDIPALQSRGVTVYYTHDGN